MPIRKGRGPFAPSVVSVGDTVRFPTSAGGHEVNVGAVSRRYFSGVSSTGERIGDTSVGLLAGQKVTGEDEPWEVRRAGR